MNDQSAVASLPTLKVFCIALFFSPVQHIIFSSYDWTRSDHGGDIFFSPYMHGQFGTKPIVTISVPLPIFPFSQGAVGTGISTLYNSG